MSMHIKIIVIRQFNKTYVENFKNLLLFYIYEIKKDFMAKQSTKPTYTYSVFTT